MQIAREKSKKSIPVFVCCFLGEKFTAHNDRLKLTNIERKREKFASAKRIPLLRLNSTEQIQAFRHE